MTGVRIKSSVVRRARRLRMERGLRTREVAKVLGISPSAVSGYELAHFGLSPRKLEMLAQLLGVSAEQLDEIERDGHGEGALHDRDTCPICDRLLELLRADERRPYSPSLRELAHQVGRSLTATYYHVKRLRIQGRVTWDPGRPRTLRLVEEPGQPE